MSDLRLISREFLTEFIAIYRENACLWKIKSKDYSDKHKRNAAYKVLIEKLKEVDGAATRDTVIKRINSLRTCFRKELKKYKMCLHSGMDEADVYKPNLWYFDLLKFLTDQETPREDGMNNLTEADIDNGSIQSEKPVDSVPPEFPLRSEASTPSTSSLRRKSMKRKPEKSNRSDEILGIVAEKLQNTGKYAAYGKHVAEELQDLPTRMAIYCKRIINEAIFQAQLGNLTENSKIVTVDNSVPQRINYITPNQSQNSAPETSTDSTNTGQLGYFFGHYNNYEEI